MKYYFDGTQADQPEMSLKGKMGWDELFQRGLWACVRNDQGHWIITDKDYDLDRSITFENEAELVAWLKDHVSDQLAADPRNYLAHFSSVSELITDKVTTAMLEAINEDEKSSLA